MSTMPASSPQESAGVPAVRVRVPGAGLPASVRSWRDLAPHYETSRSQDLAAMPEADRTAFLSSLTQAQRARMPWDPEFVCRPKQAPMADGVRLKVISAGRGFGKNFCGGHQVRSWAERFPGCRIHLVARTAADYLTVMVPSIIAVSPLWSMPEHLPSNRLVRWPNGSTALCFSAEEPDQLRGPQCQFGWLDEASAWDKAEETFENFKRGWREGEFQQALVTMTPKSVPLVMRWLRQGGVMPEEDGVVYEPEPGLQVVLGSTFENWSNLTNEYLDDAWSYAGTGFFQQEVMGIPILSSEGALWTPARLDDTRVESLPDGDAINAVTIGVDPSGSSETEMGIVAAVAMDRDDSYYVVADYSRKGRPEERWGALMQLISELPRSPRPYIVAETNYGGDVVQHDIDVAWEAWQRANQSNPDLLVDKPIVKTVKAMRGKMVRAEPTALLFNADPPRCRMVGRFQQLETEMTTYTGKGDRSPNRLDAMVWAVEGLEEIPRYGRGRRAFGIY